MFVEDGVKFLKEYFILDLKWWTIAPSESYKQIFFMKDYREDMWLNIQFISMEKVTLNKKQTEFKKWFMQKMRDDSKYITVYDFESKASKLDRIKFVLEPQFQNRTINFLHKNDHHWNILFKKLEDELLKYPWMKHDDYPDTLTQSVMVLEWKTWWKDYFWKKSEWRKPRQVIDSLTWTYVTI